MTEPHLNLFFSAYSLRNKCSVNVNMRLLEIADAANKLSHHIGVESFKASNDWLWRFCNRHGVGNKVERGDPADADISAVEPFRLKFNRLMKKEDLHLGRLYNADETALFWCSLPFKNEDMIPGR